VYQSLKSKKMDKTKMARDVFNKYANHYQTKFMDQSLYHHSFDLFCTSVGKTNAELLEIGCGPGNITQYLLKKRPDFHILGIDIAANMLDLARINNPTAEFQMMDCRDIASINKKYDAILCGFCLPYLSREEAVQLITDASRLLNPSGVIYLSTMEDAYSKSGLKGTSIDPQDQTYTHYHQEDYLSLALEENKFKIIDIRHQDYPTQDGTKVTDLLILAVK
jgi:2-polyprenyl-3-methyl-5-hydroxy-6-metoxy-1,4-benzoquinol methylase